jgi:hypothetical protein
MLSFPVLTLDTFDNYVIRGIIKKALFKKTLSHYRWLPKWQKSKQSKNITFTKINHFNLIFH